MLRPRLIPCLLLKNQGLVKTSRFADPKYVGDPINAVRIFNEKQVDELMLLDIDATAERREPDYSMIEQVAAECRMPLCYGGGVNSVEQAQRIIRLGVEKVAISSAAVAQPALVSRLAERLGSQSVVVVLDVRKGRSGRYEVWTRNGTQPTGRDPGTLAAEFEALGAGEVVVNSIDNDGQMAGYDFELADLVRERTTVPLTMLGGAGSLQHVGELVSRYGVIGAAAGSLFVFKGTYKAVLISYPTRDAKDDLFYSAAEDPQAPQAVGSPTLLRSNVGVEDQTEIVFVGNARCYHTMDWYRTVRDAAAPRRTLFLTDVIESEGHDRIVRDGDDIEHLFNVDWALLRGQSRLGDLWRNAVKALMIPIQVVSLKRFARLHSGAVFHAHTMYYMCLCWLAGIHFIGTPQGSEVLVRPGRSRVYRWFASKALAAAKYVTVDSIHMQRRVEELSGTEAAVVQNGIDVKALMQTRKSRLERSGVVSIRGMTPLYRIDQIARAWKRGNPSEEIRFIYPFWDEDYRRGVFGTLGSVEGDLGRLSRSDMYELLSATSLVISIPLSDSSPRSVYEAIFCGCSVAATYAPWVDALPECMRSRLFIVDVDDPDWLENALSFASQLIEVPYVPSESALDTFDQHRSMRRVCERFYSPADWAAA